MKYYFEFKIARFFYFWITYMELSHLVNKSLEPTTTHASQHFAPSLLCINLYKVHLVLGQCNHIKPQINTFLLSTINGGRVGIKSKKENCRRRRKGLAIYAYKYIHVSGWPQRPTNPGVPANQPTERPNVAVIATSRTRRRTQISSLRTPTRALHQTDVCTLLRIQRRVGVFRLASATFTYRNWRF